MCIRDRMIEDYGLNERKRDQPFRDAQEVAINYAFDDLGWAGAEPVMSEIALFRWTGKIPIVVHTNEIFTMLSEQDHLTEVGGELVGPITVNSDDPRLPPRTYTVLIRQQEEVNCPTLPPDQVQDILGEILTLILAANETVNGGCSKAVSYTHLRAHETPEHLVCRLLLEKKKKKIETLESNMYTK
eukprot:TRINITY_DN27111_c0_g1_i2.p1 TRINITY_DN27111_c0_g1~~TRINITY_DN27111_c0_g1_i2.p1  ORF type:complete len:186 (-),score=35.28 TRINITY_DN27111_c0_g1_i2:19-576(-)